MIPSYLKKIRVTQIRTCLKILKEIYAKKIAVDSFFFSLILNYSNG